jgi:adenylate cyclase
MSDPVRRKLTTVFCADVHGYSRLMDVDEVGTLQTLKLYRQAMTGLIERHDGRVFATAGDSVAAEFGSVVEAVQCAAEVQRELHTRNDDRPRDRRLEFRIGINLGDVMVEGDDLYGEGVNIAARLQALAAPGGVCISGTVYDQVHNKLTLGYDFMGEQTVKNIAEPVPAYSLDLSPTTAKTQHAARPRPRVPAVDPVSDDRKRWFRQRAAHMAFALAILFVINAATTSGPWTEPDTWWALWFALLFGVLVTWHALQVYLPDLVGQGTKVAGDFTFSEDAEFHGKIGRDATVASGVSVKLFGKIGRNLVIEPDAIVEVHGNVGQDVINRGGTFRLDGKVGGSERYEATEPT